MAGSIQAESAVNDRSGWDIIELVGTRELVAARLRGKDDRIPARLRQITHEPQRSLHRAAAGVRGKLKRDYQYAFHARSGERFFRNGLLAVRTTVQESGGLQRSSECTEGVCR